MEREWPRVLEFTREDGKELVTYDAVTAAAIEREAGSDRKCALELLGRFERSLRSAINVIP